MTGFAFAAVLFGVIGLGLILRAITYTPKAPPSARPGRQVVGASTSGRDGARSAASRTTAHADNPPGTPSMRDPNTRGSTSAS